MNRATSIALYTLALAKTVVDNYLDVVKLRTTPTDLSKLSNVVDNGALKKTVYNLLVTKVYASDTEIPRTSRLVTKTLYDSDKQGLQKKIGDGDKKIPNTSGLSTTQKLQRLKSRYAVLLDYLLLLLSIQNPQRLKTKYLTSLI